MHIRKTASLLILLLLACRAQAPVVPSPAASATTGAQPATPPEQGIPLSTPTPGLAPSPSATSTTHPTRTAAPSPTPTAEPPRLEVVQFQAWIDNLGNARANVLLRNPNDFPVEPRGMAYARALDAAGQIIRTDELYFLDGISGGLGFLLPGETIAANACFTCEEALLGESTFTVEFVLPMKDATGEWDLSTEVEASLTSVSFDGDSPTFSAAGLATNSSDAALDRISVRFFVFDAAGSLVGAGEMSAWDVGPGQSVAVSGYGIGQRPAGSFSWKVSVLGVNY